MMQPTQVQVERSLEALRGGNTEAPAPVAADPERRIEDVPTAVFEVLAESPPVRVDRLEQARQRLEAGEQPTADDLARRMVGRLVCDRLR
jgi:hypothetical protein